MHKAVLMILLVVPSSHAAAGWVEVAHNEFATYYSDPATIHKSGNVAQMWSLLDFKTAQQSRTTEESYLSSTSQFEYDCEKELLRQLYLAWHAGNMGGGEIVYSESSSRKWNPVPPGRIIKSLWQTACGKQ
jgi:endonuclease YncB( thermonuclease family)